MKAKIKKIPAPRWSGDWNTEWQVKAESGEIAICLLKEDAKWFAKVIKSYKPKKK